MGIGYGGLWYLQGHDLSVPSSVCAQCTRPKNLWPQSGYNKYFTLLINRLIITNALVLAVNNKSTYISFFVLWQQLMDGVSEQTRVALCIFTDALHQLWVFFRHIIQFHKEGHLLPVGQRHLYIQKK